VADGKAVVLSAPDGRGRPIPLGFEPSEIWDVSPTELKLLVVQEGSAFFTVPEAGADPPLPLEGAVLEDGTWSPDGNRVAAVLLEGSNDARLGVVNVESNEIEVVPESDGAQGNVVWGPAGSFAYVRADPNRPASLQAMVCSEDLSCEAGFTWRRGVTLLAVEEPSAG
jgi:hypothetical protein